MTEEYEKYRRAQSEAWLEHIRELIIQEKTAAELADRELAVADGLKAVDYSRTRVRTSPIIDAAERAAISHMELADRLIAASEECTAARADAVDRIARIQSPVERAFLTAYYLDSSLPSYADVAAAMCYSYDGIMKLRRRALSSAYDVMPYQWRDPIQPAV